MENFALKSPEDSKQLEKILNAVIEQHIVSFSDVSENITLVIDRSKWEPCQFCRTKNRIHLGFDGYDDAISIVTDNNAAAIESDSFGFIVGYCPMCGRPLTEQSWQELERRVFGE